MKSAKRAASSKETGRHRGEPKSRHGFFIILGTVILVLWAAIGAVFFFQSGSPPAAPAEYTPSSTPFVPKPRVLPSLPSPVKTYIAVKDDSLWSVAKKECGNGNDWKKLATANKIWWPWLVKQGRRMIIDC